MIEGIIFFDLCSILMLYILVRIFGFLNVNVNILLIILKRLLFLNRFFIDNEFFMLYSIFFKIRI